MAAILDAFPYPYHEAAARELHLTLAQLYPNPPMALTLAAGAGVDRTMIDSQQTPYLVWKDILDQAAGGGLLRPLVKLVLDRLPASSPSHGWLQDLLADQTRVRLSGEGRDAEGKPDFLARDDTVTDDEALLYHDDLTLQTGLVPALIVTLQRLVPLVRPFAS